MVASRLTSLTTSFAADAAVENTFQFICNQPTTVASVSATNESTQHLVPAWDCAASIGGVASAVVESFELDIKRNATPIFTLGTQSAYNNFQGPLEVTGKITTVVETGETLWANSLVRDQQQFLVLLTDPQTGFTVLFQMSTVQFENPVIDQSKAYVELSADFVAVANTTDNVNIGYSPLKTISTNGVSTAY